ncbi:MAG: iron-containing redox enzyme family protein [Gammaproteobacteria bacterium]|nr:iron-containing redox enzyme family protein [Gammaproteobacteria bacterium]MCW5583218.1 iron-containing redox enzyme family protein [Gammaproteobacteria bacterium]
MHISGSDLSIAFKMNHGSYLKKIHQLLNDRYYIMMFNDNEEQALNTKDIIELKHIEQMWIEHEKSDCLNRYDCYRPIKNGAIVESALQDHPVSDHPLFKYLRQDATLEEIKNFILSDSILNLEFFDYLAMSIIGVSDRAKLEIISNLWDEAGRGHIPQFHTTKFSQVMVSLNLKYNRKNIIADMSWEGLAGINLFSYLSLYSFNKTKFFGLLAATEMLDPPHYGQLIQGLMRMNKSTKINLDYYQDHQSIDIEHANGWLNNVALPILLKQPQKTPEFWLGFYLRLDSAQRYYDKILANFMTKKAA